MSNMMYMGIGGMQAYSLQLSMLGNNLANVGTTGFKSSQASFAEQFVSEGGRFPSGRRNLMGNGVYVSGSSTNWNNGALQETGNPFNLAVVGDGFLPVEHGGRTYYTRAGDFSLLETSPGSGVYELVRPNGARLMGSDGNGGLAPVRITGMPENLTVGEDGVLSDSNATVANGSVNLVRFANPDALERNASGMYESTNAAGAQDAATPGSNGLGSVYQGYLERSNVDMVTEFSEMIVSQRAFQANSKTVQTANEMLQEIVNLKR